MEDTDGLTVTEITSLIKETITENFNKVVVIGEVSNCRFSKSNLFFTLKDESSSISAVIWRCKNDQIKDGQKVKIKGRLTVFSKAGSYNITVYSIEMLGDGDLNKKYNDLKEYYNLKGYFDERIKKPIPETIEKIGVITSSDGAALQDFLYVLKNNNYLGTVFIKNCLVQGRNCASDVEKSIEELDKMDLDIIVVTRGGGSFEDLFGFSDSRVVEAIYKAKTCIVSAVGHEIDFMLSDFVADIRAPTPSVAGEVVSKRASQEQVIENLLNEIKNRITKKFMLVEHQLRGIENKLVSPIDIIEKEEHRLSSLQYRINRMIYDKINQKKEIISLVQKGLRSNQTNIYGEKYEPIKTVEDFQKYCAQNKKLNLRLENGIITLKIQDIQINE